MSIVIIRGPDAPQHQPRMPLSHALHAEIVTSLVDRAVCAGKALAIHACSSEQELLHALAEITREPPEILLVDAGAGIDTPQVSQALRHVRVPFIEIHDDSSARPEAELRDPPASRIGVVHGYLAQGYTIAMSMALEHIGCAESESAVHVGT